MSREYNVHPLWTSDKNFAYSATGSFTAQPIYLKNGYSFSLHAIASSGTPSGSFQLSGSCEVWELQGTASMPSNYIGIADGTGREFRYEFSAANPGCIMTQSPIGVPWVVPVFLAKLGSTGAIKIFVSVKGSV